MADLEQDLVDIGRRMPTPEVDLAPAVLAVLAGEPAPSRPSRWHRSVAASRRWVRARWRALLAVLLGGTLVVGVATPAGAAVLRWLRIGGVEVRQDTPPPTITSPTRPSPGTRSAPISTPPPLPGTGVGLPQAATLLGFRPLLPTELGDPARVEVSTDHRVLTLTWPDGVVLTEFAGAPDPLFVKTQVDDLQYVNRGVFTGYWFPGHHTLIYRDADGVEHTESARGSAQTLVWTVGELTLRLEGDLTLDRAVQIALTAR